MKRCQVLPSFVRMPQAWVWGGCHELISGISFGLLVEGNTRNLWPLQLNLGKDSYDSMNHFEQKWIHHKQSLGRLSMAIDIPKCNVWICPLQFANICVILWFWKNQLRRLNLCSILWEVCACTECVVWKIANTYESSGLGHSVATRWERMPARFPAASREGKDKTAADWGKIIKYQGSNFPNILKHTLLETREFAPTLRLNLPGGWFAGYHSHVWPDVSSSYQCWRISSKKIHLMV